MRILNFDLGRGSAELLGDEETGRLRDYEMPAPGAEGFIGNLKFQVAHYKYGAPRELAGGSLASGLATTASRLNALLGGDPR